MLSMTGYGRGEYKQGGLELTVEVKTVNNRYLDVAIKAPRIFFSCDDVIRSAVREKLTRGHIDIFVTLTDKRQKEKSLNFDEQLAKAYAEAARKTKNLFPDAADDFSVTSVLRYPDVLKAEESVNLDDESMQALNLALNTALEDLNGMREREGQKLCGDMLSRVDTIDGMLSEVEKRAPLVASGYAEKLKVKVQRYMDGIDVDIGRLLTEVALFADKSNIDEEMTRLHSHISQFREICKERLVGRKLDFLIQEFNRETNTICSKSNDVEITRLALAMKNEIEKIREQVQNVE